MQRSRAALTYGMTGQTITAVPPEVELVRHGAPASAAAVAVWRGTDSNDSPAIIPSANAVLDAVATTVNAASGYSQSDRRKINLASTAGITVGIPYLAKNALGESEVVVPYEVGPTYVEVELELIFDYAIGATFKGLTHTFSIPDSFATSLGNINVFGAVYWLPRFIYATTAGGAPPYRARWSYTTADGVARTYWTLFDLVRAKAKHNVQIRDLLPYFGRLLEHVGSDQVLQAKLFRALSAAWDAFVFDLKCANYPVDQLREGPAVDELIRYKAIAILASGEGIAPPNRQVNEFISEAEKRYQSAFNRAIGSTLKVWLDVGTTGAIHPDPPRNGRLRR